MGFTEDLIQRHEGLRLKVYADTAGKKTIGYGFNLDAPSASAICKAFGLDIASLKAGSSELTPEQADAVFAMQMAAVYGQARSYFPTYESMPENAKSVIADLIFNLGSRGFWAFHDTIASLKAADWNGAADNLTKSLWFKQTGHRATDDVALLRAI